MLMRPEAAFPYVFAAEGAQHPPKKAATLNATTKRTAATLNTPPQHPPHPTITVATKKIRAQAGGRN